MSADSASTRSRDYVRPIGNDWWLKRKRYVTYMIREFTCVAVGGYSFFLLLLVSRATDEAAFADLVTSLSSPLSIVLHLIALLLVIFHAVTFLNVTPKAIVLYLPGSDEKVSPTLIVVALYAAWLAVSVVIAWLALR